MNEATKARVVSDYMRGLALKRHAGETAEERAAIGAKLLKARRAKRRRPKP